MTWWQHAVWYEVYVRSFADSDGDGVGDLRGIRERLDYLEWLGVDALWITPFYPSPMADHGYDVADHRGVDPTFGSLADFDELLADAHDRGIRVVVDLVPNHVSDQHPWFQAALAAPPGSPERERFLFHDGGADGGPPNNWRSVFGGPAWTQEAQGQWYLHLFAPEQPDLSWRHPDVAADAEETIRFWLDRGVDGFRIDVAHGLFKHPDLPDNPLRTGPAAAFGEMEQRHSFNQPEVHDVYRRWRKIADDYDGDRVLLGEVFLWDPAEIAKYVRPDELHLAFNFLLLGVPWKIDDLRRAIDLSVAELAAVGASPTWALSNHDLPRHASRYGREARARAAALLLLGIGGSAFLYQGEELGLEEVDVPVEAREDPLFHRSGGAHAGRDGCRVPLPWTVAEPVFGFGPAGSDLTWLPLPDGWGDRCVDRQREDGASILHLYRRAIALRPQLGPVAASDLRDRSPDGEELLVIERPAAGGATAWVVVNLGDAPASFAATPGARLLLASDPAVTLDAAGTAQLPPDTTAWLLLTP